MKLNNFIGYVVAVSCREGMRASRTGNGTSTSGFPTYTWPVYGGSNAIGRAEYVEKRGGTLYSGCRSVPLIASGLTQ